VTPLNTLTSFHTVTSFHAPPLPRVTSQVRFRNLYNITCDLYYNDGKEGVYSGTVYPLGYSSTTAYNRHRFYWTPQGEKTNKLLEFTITPEVRDNARQSSACGGIRTGG
jgi:hypothetical protein